MTNKKINEEIFDMIIAYKNSNKKNILKEKFNKILNNKIPETLSPSDLNRLKYRKEKRGFFDFFLYVYEKTERESMIIQEWKKSLKKNGYVIDVINSGVDNNGLPITEGNKDFKNSDFTIYINGIKNVLDLKISPIIKCFTFKLDDLKKYLKNETRILLVLSTDEVPIYWSIVGDDLMNQMLDNKVGERFRHFGGFKETQRIYRDSKGKRLGYLELAKKGLIEINEF